MPRLPKCCHTLRSICISVITIVLVACTFSCIKRDRIQQFATPNENNQKSPPRININTASANELETLPGIGKGLAERIIEHREKYGPFRRPEHLIIVRGISDKRFRALRDLITVE
jgi:competence ComEA-like helix-hairpin-helix protein